MNRKIVLSDRLRAVANMVTKGNVVCDVGCDHGFVSIYLIEKGISPKVIAMDVNKGPLQAAKEHISEYALTDYIETRLSDGMELLEQGEADTVICAGMGGKLMRRIMEDGKDKIRTMKELILQPQSEQQGIREYLRNEGYFITEENIIFEDGKYYPMMKVKPLEKICSAGISANKAETDKQRIEDKYGPFLLANRNPVLVSFLEREYSICEKIINNLASGDSGQTIRRREIMDEMEDIDMARLLLTEGKDGSL